MCGVGKKMKEHLNRMGMYTCGQLGRYPVDLLVRRFGLIGRYLHNMGLGIDESPVMPADYEVRSSRWVTVIPCEEIHTIIQKLKRTF